MLENHECAGHVTSIDFVSNLCDGRNTCFIGVEKTEFNLDRPLRSKILWSKSHFMNH